MKLNRRNRLPPRLAVGRQRQTCAQLINNSLQGKRGTRPCEVRMLPRAQDNGLVHAIRVEMELLTYIATAELKEKTVMSPGLPVVQLEEGLHKLPHLSCVPCQCDTRPELGEN
eukprot:1458270-Amphidinium_carterae.1